MFITIADQCINRRQEKHFVLRTATIWQTALIPCNFSTKVAVRWRYCHAESTEVVHLTSNLGLIANNLKDRFQLEPNGLLITDVQPNDAGWYVCHQKHRRREQI